MLAGVRLVAKNGHCHAAQRWPPATLREELVKIRARIERHGRYVVFQMGKAAILRTSVLGVTAVPLLLESPSGS